MNDFLFTELAREHQSRLARAAALAALARLADGDPERVGRRRRRLLHPRPRNG